MPNWLIILCVVFVAGPGLAVIVYGVFAMFMATKSEKATDPGLNASDADLPADTAAPAPASHFATTPPLTIDALETEAAPAEAVTDVPSMEFELPPERKLPAPDSNNPADST